VLDARIRALTKDERSLDDVMRLAYARYSGERGYRPDEFVAVVSEVAGQDLAPFVEQLTQTTDELDVTEAIALFGLKLDGTEPNADEAWLGATMSGDRVMAVRRDSPAWQAGLNVDDELIAVSGDRVSGGSVERRKPGERVELLVARRGRMLTLSAELGKKPGTLAVSVDPKAAKAAQKRRLAWMGPAPGVVVEPKKKADEAKK
jgi:predicted metalloprotease with PDZ domain